MKVNVIIPFRGDGAILRWAVEGYLAQQLEPGIELTVYVGGDGCEVPPLPTSARVQVVAKTLPRVGNSQAKNLLMEGIEAGPGDVVVFGNSDTRPEEGCVQRHVTRLAELPPGSIVLGAAPFEDAKKPTVFDALKSETPMIFFYCQMHGGQWYDYRYTWTLNLAMRHEDFTRAGGFSPRLFPYGYEDLDLGFRVMGPTRQGVFYEDAAVVKHRHPMTLEQYLDREEMLGLMSPVVREINPEMFAALNGTQDVEKLGRDFRTWVEMDRAGYKWIWQRLQEWVREPAEVLGDGEPRRRLLATIYQMHIPLKRLAFRLGFLRGMELVAETRREERKPLGLWRGYVETGKKREI